MTSAQQEVASDKQKLQKFADIRTRVGAFATKMARFYSEVEPVLIEAGIPEVSRAAFKPAFPADIEQPLTRREGELKASIAQKQGGAENPAENTINWLQIGIEALLKMESADKARQEKIRAIQIRTAAINTEVQRIEKEIAQIEGPDKARIAAARTERLAAYVGYFQNLKKEKKTLEELYAPVSQRLTASRQEQALELSIRWQADIENWLERGGALFDHRRAIPYGTIQKLGEAAKKILLPAWISGKPESIGPAMEAFLEEFRKADFPPS